MNQPDSREKNPRRSITARASAIGVACLLLSAPLPAIGEADIKWQIMELTEQIAKQPRNAELFFNRGDLYRAQQNWDAAQADYDQGLAINPKADIVDFLRGRMFLEANWPFSARIALDRFLSKQTNHLEALVLRARTLVKLGDRLAASRDYTRAIELTSESRPDLYFERAEILAAAGSPFIEEALRGIDEGIKKLGPIVSLQLSAIDLEIKQQHFDAALKRLEQAAAASPRKETWWTRKGEILQQAGRTEQARAAFNAALEALNSLPPERRNVPAMTELHKRIQDQLQALK